MEETRTLRQVITDVERLGYEVREVRSMWQLTCDFKDDIELNRVYHHYEIELNTLYKHADITAVIVD